MMRRLKEDRNQHYNRLDRGCWSDPKTMARFKEQPAGCSCYMCGNPRRWNRGKDALTVQEKRAP